MVEGVLAMPFFLLSSCSTAGSDDVMSPRYGPSPHNYLCLQLHPPTSTHPPTTTTTTTTHPHTHTHPHTFPLTWHSHPQFVGPFVSVYFLGSSLTFMLVYLWGRRNPQVGMNFLGLFTFNADFLPWVLLGLSLLLNHNIVADLIGIAVGHVYYFLEDVYPKPEAQGGLGGPRLLKTPNFVRQLRHRFGSLFMHLSLNPPRTAACCVQLLVSLWVVADNPRVRPNHVFRSMHCSRAPATTRTMTFRRSSGGPAGSNGARAVKSVGKTRTKMTATAGSSVLQWSRGPFLCYGIKIIACYMVRHASCTCSARTFEHG